MVRGGGRAGLKWDGMGWDGVRWRCVVWDALGQVVGRFSRILGFSIKFHGEVR